MGSEPPFNCPSCGRPTSGPDPYCDRCSGKRNDPPSDCPECGGAGVIGEPRRQGPPTRPRTVQDLCPTCDGGYLIEPPFNSDSAAPHFHTRRPIHLCADGRDDDDQGPPNWSARDAE